MVSGWPTVASRTSHTSWQPDTSVLGELLHRGILTTVPEEGCASPRPEVPDPDLTLANYEDPLQDGRLPTLPTPRSVFRFLAACLRAGIDTRFRSLDSVVRSLARRESAPPMEQQEMVRAQELVSTYRHLRPLFFGSAQRCLFSSLSLLHFLRASGIRVSWVFGVQLSPFAAHCWLQRGPVVINDRLERVRRFTPVMVV
jgi:hypothetical protein